MGKLSVITITRNNYNELVKTINSLDSLPEHQLIVINGGECQQTRQFLREQGIEHVSEPDDGIADAFNKGVRIALKNTSDYIIFINSGDVVISSSYAKKAVHFLEKNRAFDFSYGDIIFRDSLAGDIYMPSGDLNLGRGMAFCHQTMIYRKSVFEKVGLFNQSYKIAMDYEHICRMTKSRMKGHRIISPAFVLMDGAGISATNEWESLKECGKALIESNLMVGNKWSLFVRIVFFVARKALVTLKLSKILTALKRKKYSLPIRKSDKPGDFVIVTNSYQRDISLVERSLGRSLGQNPPPQRVIFIDQNKNKLQFKREIAENPLLHHLHVCTTGVSAARNSFDISKNIEWMIFCDDDGYLMEGYTKKFLELAECQPWLEVIAGSIVRDDNGEFYTPRHKLGRNINKFFWTKLLMGSNFACKAATFKRLGGFDERFGAGSYWGSGEETDFAWKAHFAKVQMLYCPDLKVIHIKPYASTFANNFRKAFFYGRGKGALVAKWIVEERKLKPFCEIVEMTLVPLGQVVKSALTLSPEKVAIFATTLVARYWGFFAFVGKSLLPKGREKRVQDI